MVNHVNAMGQTAPTNAWGDAEKAKNLIQGFLQDPARIQMPKQITVAAQTEKKDLWDKVQEAYVKCVQAKDIPEYPRRYEDDYFKPGRRAQNEVANGQKATNKRKKAIRVKDIHSLPILKIMEACKDVVVVKSTHAYEPKGKKTSQETACTFLFPCKIVRLSTNKSEYGVFELTLNKTTAYPDHAYFRFADDDKVINDAYGKEDGKRIIDSLDTLVKPEAGKLTQSNKDITVTLLKA